MLEIKFRSLYFGNCEMRLSEHFFMASYDTLLQLYFYYTLRYIIPRRNVM